MRIPRSRFWLVDGLLWSAQWRGWAFYSKAKGGCWQIRAAPPHFYLQYMALLSSVLTCSYPFAKRCRNAPGSAPAEFVRQQLSRRSAPV